MSHTRLALCADVKCLQARSILRAKRTWKYGLPAPLTVDLFIILLRLYIIREYYKEQLNMQTVVNSVNQLNT